MKESTARIVRASLLSQKTAKNRVLEGYAAQVESLRSDIRKWRAQISAAEDTIRRAREDMKATQEDIAGIVDAYHDLWDEEFPADDELKR